MLRAETSPGGSEQESIQAAGHRKGGGGWSTIADFEPGFLKVVTDLINEPNKDQMAFWKISNTKLNKIRHYFNRTRVISIF